ncbi:MAG: PQQ-binding-like beta-propeller repeat protein [Phycisphaeraceae bacterium]
MRRTTKLSILLILAFAFAGILPLTAVRGQTPSFKDTDWPWWRGPGRDGIASSNQKPPVKWSSGENIVWKTPIPGRGHGSVTVVGDQVFIATADLDAQEQSVFCLDRDTGAVKWKFIAHDTGLLNEGNKKASLASSTPACDGDRVFINFLNNRAIHTTALSREGKKLWQTKITDYTIHQGFATSPTVYESLVLVAADNKGTGAWAGLNRDSGQIVWKHARPKLPNYASPIIYRIGGKDQLVFMGCKLVTSLSPLTGKVNWEKPGSTEETVSSIVTDGTHLFTSGGWPENHIAAMKADGSGKIAWKNGTRVYVPSMIVKGEHLFAVTDAGVAMCWVAATGEALWKGRLGGTFSSSPVLVGDVFYAINEAGECYLFKANPKEFELVGKNKLGDEVFATPTIVGGRIYVRIAEHVNGKRQESVVCIGEK